MPRIDALVRCAIRPSFRVSQVAGMFDLPPADEAVERFSVDLPGDDEPWRIGLIVGPSGSGKSTIARAAYGADIAAARPWPHDRAVVDCLGDCAEGGAPRSIRQITAMLAAVGFSSPPAWIKPYHVLSSGEQFRCDLARALLTGGRRVVCDEFTSAVDRTAARIGSLALAKAVRRTPERQFVAVTCHYDAADWLSPDWVLDMASGRLARGRLRRPDICLGIHRCGHGAWPLFARHHYLSAALNRSAHCYLGLIDGEPAAFCAVLSAIGRRGVWRVSRIVVLPDYQGVGIGRAMLRGAAGFYPRLRITTGHTALMRTLAADPAWRLESLRRGGYTRQTAAIAHAHFHGGAIGGSSAGRCVATFEWKQNAPCRTPASLPRG